MIDDDDDDDDDVDDDDDDDLISWLHLEAFFVMGYWWTICQRTHDFSFFLECLDPGWA